MVTATRLLSEGASVARRQGWSLIPLWLAWIVARLFALLPSAFLAAFFLERGFQSGAPDAGSAWITGFFDALDEGRPWGVAAAGWVLASIAAVLVVSLIEAGVLRQFSVQVGRTEIASDEAFAEGMVGTPGRWMVAMVLAAVLKVSALAAALGALASGVASFVAHPGALTALLMTFAIGVLLIMPLCIAAADVGFARAVIVDEPPLIAFAEGLVLAFTRLGALLPAWYVLAVVDLLAAFVIGLVSMPAGMIPLDHGLWILRLGPASMVGIVSIGAMAAIELWRLGVYTTLLADGAGTLPPAPVRARPVFHVAPAAPSAEELVLTAREISPAPPAGTTPANPDEARGDSKNP